MIRDASAVYNTLIGKVSGRRKASFMKVSSSLTAAARATDLTC